ncbi:SAM-dependent methyltransferase [Calothrix sp. HK-06]|nr:SAM-dependent methyltransferase [Calothrix sp. HK-06]
MQKPTIHFDSNPTVPTSEYDEMARQVLPGYEAMHTMALSILKSQLPTTANLLIVGAGTGMELIRYSQSNPKWSFLGIDPSANMLEIARTKIEQHNLSERITLQQTYTHELTSTPLYDAATSILVMHFIPDDSKLGFLQSIAQRLKEGAPFILVDIFGKKGTPEFERIITYIQSYWQEMGRTEINIKEMLATFEKGIYPVEEARVYELLQQTGFTNITRFYTGLWVGGWVASRG